jgi:hypothetical protein
MNAKTVLFGIIVFGLASTALSINDARLAANEYRWILVDGPYACPSKTMCARLRNTIPMRQNSKWSASSEPITSSQGP